MVQPACFDSFAFGAPWGMVAWGDCESVVFRIKPLPAIMNRVLGRETSGNGNRFIELYGSEMAPSYHYEPDASTAREDYYYNSRHNVLYKKIPTSTVPFWQPVSREEGIR